MPQKRIVRWAVLALWVSGFAYLIYDWQGDAFVAGPGIVWSAIGGLVLASLVEGAPFLRAGASGAAIAALGFLALLFSSHRYQQYLLRAAIKRTIDEVSEKGLGANSDLAGNVDLADFKLPCRLVRRDETFGAWEVWVEFSNGHQYYVDLDDLDDTEAFIRREPDKAINDPEVCNLASACRKRSVQGGTGVRESRLADGTPR
jgi:hypothetical protein